VTPGNQWDTTKTPVLLGYQLRALPVPRRQRMIRMPLLLVDNMISRAGQRLAKRASARDALFELEALEAAQAVVEFEDYRTGETGEAFIESVEFDNRTPSSKQESGFGGTAFVTLRVLS